MRQAHLPASSSLAHSELGELALEWGLKSQHDVTFGNTFVYKNLSDIGFCAVVLDPDFSFMNVYMQDNAVDTLLFIPTHGNDLIMIMLSVENQLRFDIRFAVIMLEFGKLIFNNFSVAC